MAVITISRQYASEGRFFAQDLAKALNYSYADKKIYEKVAEKENITISDLEALENISGLGIDFFQKLIDNDYIKRIIGKKDLTFEHDEVIKAISNTIYEIAQKGNVVIVGRGAQCILQEYPGAYHIRIVRKYEDRISLMMKRGVTKDGAISTIKRKDEERRNYIKKFYNQDWDNPELYHLTINLSRVSTLKGIDIVKTLIGS